MGTDGAFHRLATLLSHPNGRIRAAGGGVGRGGGGREVDPHGSMHPILRTTRRPPPSTPPPSSLAFQSPLGVAACRCVKVPGVFHGPSVRRDWEWPLLSHPPIGPTRHFSRPSACANGLCGAAHPAPPFCRLLGCRMPTPRPISNVLPFCVPLTGGVRGSPPAPAPVPQTQAHGEQQPFRSHSPADNNMGALEG